MYSYKSRIRYSELDETGHLRLESLLDYFQDCSTFHSEESGLGVDYLKTHNLVWVLSSWQIVVEHYPKLGETVTVGTAPYELKGFIGFRNFLMTDQEGKRLSYANTLWSLLDTRSGKPARPSQEMLRGYVLEPRLDMEYAPRRIAIPENGREGEPVQIRPHHLDTNHHVNNGQFVRIALDALKRSCQVSQLRAEYKKQAVLGDVLTPFIAQTADGGCVVSLRDQEGAVSCVVELREKKQI